MIDMTGYLLHGQRIPSPLESSFSDVSGDRELTQQKLPVMVLAWENLQEVL